MHVASQQFRDVKPSQCWSFGSINHPSSQSRKISIGVVVDSISKKKSEATKEDGVSVPDSERIKSDVGASTKGKRNKEQVAATKKTKPSEAPLYVNSPWITPARALQQKATNSATVLCAEQTSNLPASGSQYQIDGAKNTQFQFFTKNTSVFPTDDINRNEFVGVTYERRGRKDGLAENLEFQFAAVQDVLVSDKDRMKDTANAIETRRTQSLKMKLQEILGTVSSPDDHHSKSLTHELGANGLNTEQNLDKMDGTVGKPGPNADKPELKLDQMGDKVAKPGQNSDTIETDSEGPDDKIRRPVTRSFTRKRAPIKQRQKATKCGQPSGHKLENQNNNIFTFEEGWCGRSPAVISGGSSMPAQKRSEKNSSKFGSCKIFLADTDVTDQLREATYRSETQQPAQEISSFGKRIKNFQGSLPNNERKYVLEENIQERDSQQSPKTNKTDQHRDFDSLEYRDQQEDVVSPSLKNVVNLQDEFQSPTLGIKKSLSSSSPSSTQKTDKMVDNHSDPAQAVRTFTMGGVRSFRSVTTSNLDYGSAREESSDDDDELKDYPIRKVAFEMEEKNTEEGLSESSSEGFKDTETPLPDANTAEELNFMFRPTKRLCSNEKIAFNYIRTRESSGRQEPECSQLDGMDRAVELFMLQFEKLKRKMKVVASTKTSEILMASAENMHLLLQNVESQIQTDVGKLTSLSKLKRKRLEARFQEQQEQIKLIYAKFKEEMDQHLQDCKITFEGLEADQLEFKGNMEKQKALHRKLFLQVEEGMETLLSDTQRRIKAVHELTRGKLTQLKQVIALCLKEGMLD